MFRRGAHLDEPAPTLAATAAQIAAFHPDGALLLARIPTQPRHRVTTLTLPNIPASAATARHHTTHTLTTWGMHPDLMAELSYTHPDTGEPDPTEGTP